MSSWWLSPLEPSHPRFIGCYRWFPGRGQRITDPSIRRLLSPDQCICLFARQRATFPFVFCGRLRPLAVSLPAHMCGATRDRNSPLPVWPCVSESTHLLVPHIIWELIDAPELLKPFSSIDEVLFGKRCAILPMRPTHWEDEIRYDDAVGHSI